LERLQGTILNQKNLNSEEIVNNSVKSYQLELLAANESYK